MMHEDLSPTMTESKLEDFGSSSSSHVVEHESQQQQGPPAGAAAAEDDNDDDSNVQEHLESLKESVVSLYALWDDAFHR